MHCCLEQWPTAKRLSIYLLAPSTSFMNGNCEKLLQHSKGACSNSPANTAGLRWKGVWACGWKVTVSTTMHALMGPCGLSSSISSSNCPGLVHSCRFSQLLHTISRPQRLENYPSGPRKKDSAQHRSTECVRQACGLSAEWLECCRAGARSTIP